MSNLSDAADILKRAKEKQESQTIVASAELPKNELPVYNLKTADETIVVKMMDPPTPKKGEEIIAE